MVFPSLLQFRSKNFLLLKNWTKLLRREKRKENLISLTPLGVEVKKKQEKA
jgi:hypothetical protein